MELKVHYDDRIYTTYFESHRLIQPSILEIKVVLYNTTYTLLRDQTANVWSNAETNRLKLSAGLAQAVGQSVADLLNELQPGTVV